MKRNTWHVMPIGDIEEHTEECFCGPREELINGGRLLIHNSLDGREYKERGEDITTGIAIDRG